jgi:outer membrane protein OmpA-like peptidoglycan-associated protein
MVEEVLKFASAQSKLSRLHLTQIRKFVEKLPIDVSLIMVDGFSDPSGDHEFNLALSKARSSAVAANLKNLGVKRHNIQIRSFGERSFEGNTVTGQLSRSVVLRSF